ncbi:hypothetical protein C1T17_09205 [Sphingobium sp. SCG-1]|uniref:hypothetical protein n=1 Tax=Sphingobium sp. SCG-1 TaxID=2072936 RepID=UPI000CD6BDC7|nr:hypothetical protein [Sphingobium sp. SCG-1]AUW58256.1 hypothetical protein C1T17_09205 [Sphingobium sp. SCG-1]
MTTGGGNEFSLEDESSADAADILVGDIVSWEGDDRHEVISTNSVQGQRPTLIEIRCLQPSAGWLNDEATARDAPWATDGDVNSLGADEVDLVLRLPLPVQTSDLSD